MVRLGSFVTQQIVSESLFATLYYCTSTLFNLASKEG